MRRSSTGWVWRWGPAVLMMAVIFMASGTPGRDLPSFGSCDFLAKKGGHMIGYALLAASYLRGLVRTRSTPWRLVILALVLTGCYAVTDEFHQGFTPGRTPSATDVGIDIGGGAIGTAIWVLLRR
jgi:VanZ family protein